MDKRIDGYETYFFDQSDMVADVEEMDDNSVWLTDVPASSLLLEAVFPVEAVETAQRYGLDETLTMETAGEGSGTQLILMGGSEPLLVRSIAKNSLCETAKLSGSALGRMLPVQFASTLNYGFEVGKGNTILLKRYDKLSACHSCAEGGYEVMKISELMQLAIKAVGKFGDAVFVEGYNSHQYTCCTWLLPDAQGDLLQLYQDALDSAGTGSRYSLNYMPALRFSSSDTSMACATLTPLFRLGSDRYIRFVDGVKVKHTKRGYDKPALRVFEEECEGIYAKFMETAEVIEKLAGVTIHHPENCLIGLCKKYNIAKRYAEPARQEICNFLQSGSTLSAHDVYLALTAATAEAEMRQAGKQVVVNIEEALSRIVQLQDWRDYDVGGTVTW